MSDVQQQTPAGWYPDAAGVMRWWDGRAWTEHVAPQQQAHAAYAVQPYYAGQQVVMQQRKNYKTSHAFHLVMSIITLGVWVPVWIIVGLYNASKA